MSDNISRRSALKLSVLGMVLSLAIAIPASVWASHHFNDVPTNHPFHKQISAIAEAGITTGFGDGGFHPSDPVTRQAMAAFLQRGLGRITTNTTAAGTSEPVSLGSSATTLTSVAMDSGAQGNAASGFVWLTGTAHITSTLPSACPCHVELSIWDADSNTQLAATKLDVGGSANEYGSSVAAVSVSAIAQLGGEATGRYALRATRFDSSTSLQGAGSLTAAYIPFGPSGDDILAYCSLEEAEPNDSRAQAKALGSQPIDGCISNAGDSDYFSITVPQNQFVTIWTQGVGGFGTCDMNTLLRLRNASGTMLDQDGDDGWGNCNYLLSGPLSAGTYYLEVSGEAGSTGSYQIQDYTP